MALYYELPYGTETLHPLGVSILDKSQFLVFRAFKAF